MYAENEKFSEGQKNYGNKAESKREMNHEAAFVS